MAVKIRIFISQIKLRDQDLKNHFSKGLFFNEILVKEAEHKYIYIAEMKFENSISFKKGGRNSFCHIAKKC